MQNETEILVECFVNYLSTLVQLKLVPQTVISSCNLLIEVSFNVRPILRVPFFVYLWHFFTGSFHRYILVFSELCFSRFRKTYSSTATF
jgi:hypothetical protein